MCARTRVMCTSYCTNLHPRIYNGLHEFITFTDVVYENTCMLITRLRIFVRGPLPDLYLNCIVSRPSSYAAWRSHSLGRRRAGGGRQQLRSQCAGSPTPLIYSVFSLSSLTCRALHDPRSLLYLRVDAARPCWLRRGCTRWPLVTVALFNSKSDATPAFQQPRTSAATQCATHAAVGAAGLRGWGQHGPPFPMVFRSAFAAVPRE